MRDSAGVTLAYLHIGLECRVLEAEFESGIWGFGGRGFKFRV